MRLSQALPLFDRMRIPPVIHLTDPMVHFQFLLLNRIYGWIDPVLMKSSVVHENIETTW